MNLTEFKKQVRKLRTEYKKKYKATKSKYTYGTLEAYDQYLFYEKFNKATKAERLKWLQRQIDMFTEFGEYGIKRGSRLSEPHMKTIGGRLDGYWEIANLLKQVT